MRECMVEVGRYVIDLYFLDNNTENMLLEGKHRGVPLIGPYSTQRHIDSQWNGTGTFTYLLS
jgi:hypothetical protein